MKKLATIFLSLLLVLIIGQAAFANDTIRFKAGYSTLAGEASGLNIGFSADYEIWSLITLEGSFETDLFFNEGMLSLAPIGLGFKTKIDILTINSFEMGLQIALKDVLILLNDGVERGGLNFLSLGVGAYASIAVSPKFTIYTDLNVPFLHLISALGDYRNEPGNNNGIGFALFYDVKLGVIYNINYHVSLGFETSYESMLNLLRIGVNVGYTF